MPARRNHAIRAQRRARLAMTRYLILSFLLTTISAGSIGASEFRFLPHMATDPVKIRLVLDDSNSSTVAAAPDASKSCEGVTFTRNLKYRENDQTVLDVATADV